MAGRNKRRREAFFAQHRFCCFCGGQTPATEIDHIPARYLFLNRQWPVGYEFPACGACNDASAADELVMGFLVRIQLRDLTPDEERDTAKATQQLADRHPEIVARMKELSRTETRRYLRDRGMSLSSFQGLGEPYIVTMPGELTAVPERYGDKLGRALYYHHTGRIVPPSGGVTVKAMSNAQFMAPDFPWQNFSVLSGIPAITRSGVSLHQQFNYRYAVAFEDGTGGGAFMMQFGEGVAILALVYEDRAAYEARRTARFAAT